MLSVTTFEPEGDGTRYTARARRWSSADMRRHVAMGFHPGWDLAADQLAAVAERLARGG